MLSNYKNCHNLPSLEEFVRIMRKLGIDPMVVLAKDNKPPEQQDPVAESKRLRAGKRRQRVKTSA